MRDSSPPPPRLRRWRPRPPRCPRSRRHRLKSRRSRPRRVESPGRAPAARTRAPGQKKARGGGSPPEPAPQTVGYIFSRTWGGVGWFGSFGVRPEFQGRGIGKALLLPSLDYLGRAPRIIGLETGLESPYNLGLYLRQG